MITLARTLPIKTFDAMATVAVSTAHCEMLAIAQLAKEMGEITSRNIIQELFQPLPEALGKRLLVLGVFHNLLEYTHDARDTARLSDDGQKLLEENAVLTPMEGWWRFYDVDDPLVPHPLLPCARPSSNGGGNFLGSTPSKQTLANI